jgi:hypothetical protein
VTFDLASGCHVSEEAQDELAHGALAGQASGQRVCQQLPAAGHVMDAEADVVLQAEQSRRLQQVRQRQSSHTMSADHADSCAAVDVAGDSRICQFVSEADDGDQRQ